MIGRLKGTVARIREDHALLDVGGVGYLVHAPGSVLAKLVEGEAATLFIETHVREDHIHLFGFLSEAEQDAFRLLLTVSGVGPKAALAILSVHAPDALATILMSGDAKAFGKISGIGPKLATRLITELKDKALKFTAHATLTFMPSVTGSAPAPAAAATSREADAISALTHLGYNRSEAYLLVTQAAKDYPDAKVEELIRHCLKELAA